MFRSTVSAVVVFSLCMGCGGNPPPLSAPDRNANSSELVPPNEQGSREVATEHLADVTKPKYDIPENLRPYDVKSDFPLMTAEQIAKEFTADIAAAKTKYTDKAVHLTGTVGAIDTSDGACNLYLKGVQTSDGEFKVNCGIALLDRYSDARCKIMKVGDSVTLFGDVYISSFESGPMTELSLLTCFIVEQP